MRRLQLSSDLRYLPRFAKSVRELEALEKAGANTAHVFQTTAARYPNKEALVCDGKAHTFRQVDELSNRVAHWALAQVRDEACGSTAPAAD